MQDNNVNLTLDISAEGAMSVLKNILSVLKSIATELGVPLKMDSSGAQESLKKLETATSGAKGELKGLGDEGKQVAGDLEKDAGRATGGMSSAINGFLLTARNSIQGVKELASIILPIIQKPFEMAEARAKAIKGVESILQSTGRASEITSGEIVNMSKQLQAVNKYTVKTNDIIDVQNIVLGMRNISKDAIPGVTQTIIDLAAKMHTDLREAAMTVSIAMENPEEAFRRLRTAGILFDDQEKKNIKTLIEHGDMQQAQAVIMEKLSEKTKGFAASQATGWDAAYGQMQASVNGLMLDIGNGLAPALTSLMQFISNVVAPTIQGITDLIHNWSGAFMVLGIAIAAVTTAMVYQNIVSAAETIALKAMYAWSGLVTAVKLVQTTVTNGLAAAQVLVNAAMEANPIGFFIVVAAALAAIISVVIDKTIGWQRAIKNVQAALNAAWNYISAFAQAVVGVFSNIGIIMQKVFSGDFSGAWAEIRKGFDKSFAGLGTRTAAEFREANKTNGNSAQPKPKPKPTPGKPKPTPGKPKPKPVPGKGTKTGNRKKANTQKEQTYEEKINESLKYYDALDKLDDNYGEDYTKFINGQVANLEKLRKEKGKAFSTEDMSLLSDLRDRKQKNDKYESAKGELKGLSTEIDNPESRMKSELAGDQAAMQHEQELDSKLAKLKIDSMADGHEKELALLDQWYNDQQETELYQKRAEARDTIDRAHYEKKMALAQQELTQNNVISRTLLTGYDTLMQNMLASDMTGSQKRKAVWNSMKSFVFQILADTLKKFLVSKAAELFAHESTETAKTASTEEGVIMRAAILVGDIAKTLVDAGAHMVSAVASAIEWEVASFGPFAIASIPASIAAMGGIFSAAKKAFGFEQGGRFTKGQSGFIEGYGDEIIAPEHTFLDVMRQDLIPKILNITQSDNISSSMNMSRLAMSLPTSIPIGYAGSPGSPELLGEMRSMNKNLNAYSRQRAEAHIGESEYQKAFRQASAEARRGSL